MTLQQAVFAGLVDPGNLVAVREITYPKAGTDEGSVDTAVYSDFESNYTVTTLPAGATMGDPGSVTTVTDNRGGTNNGTDTLRNIEKLVFYDTAAPAAPVIAGAVPGDASATVSWTAPGGTVSTYQVEVLDSTGNIPLMSATVPGGTLSVTMRGLVNGVSYRFRVSAVNPNGTSGFSAVSNVVVPAVVPPVTPPATPPATTPPTPPVTPPSGGSSGGTPPSGAPATPAVHPRLSSKLTASSVRVHGKAALTGSVTPFRGVTVSLTRQRADGSFRTIARTVIPKTAADGWYSLPLPTTTSGWTSYRVVVSGPGVTTTTGPIRTLGVYRVRVAGVASAGREYVTLRNTGVVVAQLAGWRLRSSSGATLTLPRYRLEPGETLRVRTGAGRSAPGWVSLGRRANVWRAHGSATLVDPAGTTVATLRY